MKNVVPCLLVLLHIKTSRDGMNFARQGMRVQWYSELQPDTVLTGSTYNLPDLEKKVAVHMTGNLSGVHERG